MGTVQLGQGGLRVQTIDPGQVTDVYMKRGPDVRYIVL